MIVIPSRLYWFKVDVL